MESFMLIPENFWVSLFSILLAFSATMGALAVVSPRVFSTIATYSSQWVDSHRALALLDKKFDLDCVVLRHSRLFGTVVLVAVAILTSIAWQRFS